jgi:hypothetical protein
MRQRQRAPHEHEHGDYAEGRESACLERGITCVTMTYLHRMRIALVIRRPRPCDG